MTCALGLMVAIFAMVSVAAAQSEFPAVLDYALPQGYPPAARAVHAEGEVLIAVQVATNGKVLTATAITGRAFLRRVSEDAARRWVFAMMESESFLTLRFIYKIQPKKGPLIEHGMTGPYRIQFTDRFEPEIITTPSYGSAHR